MNIVIYARFSSHTQNEQSIEGQLKVCYEYAERNGYKVIGEYIDRAISGKAADNRPEFQRMISDSAKRQFDAVLVYQLDRFARNRYDSATCKNRLRKNGVRVVSAKETIADDASGILMESVLEGMAEYYSAELSQKVKRGKRLNADKGLYDGAVVPLGMKIVDRKYVIDDDTAPIVRHIFEMYLADNTMADIIHHLNLNGVKTSKGNPYNKNSIRRILTNVKYKGVYNNNGAWIPDGIPRIIDDEIFEQVKVLMEKNKKAPARIKTVDECYLLTTKLFCGHCGCAMVGVSGTSHTKRIYQYYACVSQIRHKGCKKERVKKDYIEDLVVDTVLKTLNNDYIDDVAHRISELSLKERNSPNLKRLKKLIKENESATANLIKALEVGKAADVISTQIEKRQAEKADLDMELAKEMMVRPVLTYDEVRFFFERFRKGDSKNSEFRMSLIDMLVNKIYLYDGDDGRVEIYCNASNKSMDIPLSNKLPLDKPRKGSYKGQSTETKGFEPLRRRTDLLDFESRPFSHLGKSPS